MGRIPSAGRARQPALLCVEPAQTSRQRGRRLTPRAGQRAAGYRLSVPDADCDLGRFIIEKAAGVQAAAASKFDQASRHLSAALAEWCGPVLEDLRDFPFVDACSAALVGDKVIAHTARAEDEIVCGQSYAVIGELEVLTAEHRIANRFGRS